MTFIHLLALLICPAFRILSTITSARNAGREDREMKNKITQIALMGSAEIRNDSPAFEGGTLIALLGSIELDLTGASLPADGATLFVISLMGDVALRVPREWRVEMGGLPILSDNKDKTQPPIDADAPTLRIESIAMLGDTTVRSAMAPRISSFRIVQ
jgi:predicted membrane protein